MCNDRAPPKKASGREPGAQRSRMHHRATRRRAQGGVLDVDRASPAFAQRSAINRRSVRGRALGAARQERLPCRHRECAARRGAAARRRGLSSATIKGRRQHNPPIPSQTRYAKPSDARRPSRRPTGARQSDRKTYILRLPANLHVGPYIAATPTETLRLEPASSRSRRWRRRARHCRGRRHGGGTYSCQICALDHIRGGK
jgi:hypothetical protein